MQTHKVYLTPISPIHIGCGEDFEPTNYVIDDGVLYHFEPSNLNLDQTKRQELLNKANSQDLLAIQRFFIANKALAKAQTHYFTDVATGIEQNYQQRIGRVAQHESNGNKVVAQLAIERTAYLPYANQVYIPASGLKGSLITAILNKKHQENGNKKVDKKEAKMLTKQYVGEFAESLGRYIRFGDFISTGDVSSKVYFSVNYKKVESKSGKDAKGLPLRREAVLNGQYRAFCSELVLAKVGKGLQESFKAISISAENLIHTLNKFYLPIFKTELQQLLDRRLVNTEWVNSVLKIVENNNVALIRLGKNGADSKVYQGKDIAQIKIMKGKGMGVDYKDRATTVWLAAENDSSTTGLLPFGWAVLEFDCISDNQILKNWCEQQPKSTFDKTAILAKRAEIEAEKERQHLVELEKIEQVKQAEEAEKARLNALSKNQKLVEEKLTQWAIQEKKQFTVSPIFSEAKKLLEDAQQWNKEDRQFLYEKIDPTKANEGLQKYVDGLSGFSNLKAKSAVEFKKLRNKLVAE